MADKQLTTRIGLELHRRLKVQAVLAGRSIEEIVAEALEDWLTVVEKEKIER